MDEKIKKSRLLIMPYGMYCDYELFLEAGYSHLADKPKFILFIAPSYNYCTSELLTFDNREFARLEKKFNFDRAFFDKISLKRNFQREDLFFEREELLSPHIKYLRKHKPEYKCFPILYNNIKYGVIKSIIEEYWNESLFVLLTSMSIGMIYDEAKSTDEDHALELEHNIANHLSHMDFSAYKILPELMEFNKENNYVLRRIALQNSADVSNNMASTTGYGAWYLDKNVK